jgi:hypothetical protein
MTRVKLERLLASIDAQTELLKARAAQCLLDDSDLGEVDAIVRHVTRLQAERESVLLRYRRGLAS